MMFNEKACKIGFILGLITALLGLCVLFGAFDNGGSNPSGAGYLYDSGYAEFGADFYTYVTNNAQEAASAARSTAHNVSELIKLTRIIGGLLLTSIGLTESCFFGLHFCVKDKKPVMDRNPEPMSEEYHEENNSGVEITEAEHSDTPHEV